MPDAEKLKIIAEKVKEDSSGKKQSKKHVSGDEFCYKTVNCTDQASGNESFFIGKKITGKDIRICYFPEMFAVDEGHYGINMQHNTKRYKDKYLFAFEKGKKKLCKSYFMCISFFIFRKEIYTGKKFFQGIFLLRNEGAFSSSIPTCGLCKDTFLTNLAIEASPIFRKKAISL